VGIAEVTNGYYMHTLNCFFVKVLNYLLPFCWGDIFIYFLRNFEKKVFGDDFDMEQVLVDQNEKNAQ
jgi:hypothetical protein